VSCIFAVIVFILVAVRRDPSGEFGSPCLTATTGVASDMKMLTAMDDAKAEEGGEKKNISDLEWKKLLNLLIQLRKVCR